jgi:hypothetical protein
VERLERRGLRALRRLNAETGCAAPAAVVRSAGAPAGGGAARAGPPAPPGLPAPDAPGAPLYAWQGDPAEGQGAVRGESRAQPSLIEPPVQPGDTDLKPILLMLGVIALVVVAVRDLRRPAG